jgi:uncharacterized repeat protein (TIGR03847 family)
MPRRRYLFDLPDRFVAGTIGEPGNRTFFLQARDGGRLVTIVLEKVQVAVLADRLNDLLEELDRRGVVPPPDAAPPVDLGPLDEPLREAFRAGTLTLGWNGDDEVVLVEARAERDEEDGEPPDEDDEDGPDVLSVRLSPAAARTFVERAVRVVASGRPPCPVCGQPLDPHGHICPRRNGHYVN